MANTYFPVRYSQLQPDAIKEELVKRYGLPSSFSCHLFDFGLNDIYIIKVDEEVYYLRVSLAGIYEKKDYEEETSIILNLHSKNINVAAPIACNDGSYLWEINAPEGKRNAVLFEEAKKNPSDHETTKAFNLGQSLARLHREADEQDFKVSRAPIDLLQLAQKPMEMIFPYLKHRSTDYEFLSNAVDKLCCFVKENLSLEKPYYGYCHGDIHGGNVFFDGDEPKIFDFDCMGYGWRAYDICVYAWNETGSDEKYVEKEPWKAFLDGYCSIRKLDEIEFEAINVFAALRELWLMGLHAGVMERNAGCCWYNDGYFDFRIKQFKLWYHRFIPEGQK
jgi:Ser/Thr protein kinase RdoA (MazF antagonist)